MPRATLPQSAPVGAYPVLPLAANSADVVMTAANTTDLNQVAFGTSGRLLIIAHNSGGSAATVTFTSARDQYNRVGDISAYSIDAGEVAAFVFSRAGWQQTDGFLYLQASAVGVRFGVIPL